jgi:hypothetical protein
MEYLTTDLDYAMQRSEFERDMFYTTEPIYQDVLESAGVTSDGFGEITRENMNPSKITINRQFNYSVNPKGLIKPIICHSFAVKRPVALSYINYSTQPGWYKKQKLMELMIKCGTVDMKAHRPIFVSNFF